MFNHDEVQEQPISLCAYDITALTAHNHRLLNTEKASGVLACSIQELEGARTTGYLWGTLAPQFIYADGKYLYSNITLGEWIYKLEKWQKKEGKTLIYKSSIVDYTRTKLIDE